MRKKLIAGNWKMNKTAAEARAFIGALGLPDTQKCDVALCVPFTALWAAAAHLKPKGILTGAQTMHFAAAGAYTGEISAEMLREAGADCVILGHSERRQYYAETDGDVCKKRGAAIAAGLIPIVCVGESLAEREGGDTRAVLKRQVEAAFAGAIPADLSKSVIAYEPIWAIGTGRTAGADEANEAARYIREVLRRLSGAAADDVRILYGGSMNGKNASQLLKQSDIDGGLVGGASLNPADFSQILHAV